MISFFQACTSFQRKKLQNQCTIANFNISTLRFAKQKAQLHFWGIGHVPSFLSAKVPLLIRVSLLKNLSKGFNAKGYSQEEVLDAGVQRH